MLNKKLFVSVFLLLFIIDLPFHILNPMPILVKGDSGIIKVQGPTNPQIIASDNAAYSLMANGTYQAYFKTNSKDSKSVRFQNKGYTFDMDISTSQLHWYNSTYNSIIGMLQEMNPQNTVADVSGFTLTYSNAWINTDLKYQTCANELKETLIIHAVSLPSSSIKPDYLQYVSNCYYNNSLTIYANGVGYLHPSNQKFTTDGEIHFNDANNYTVFWLPRPIIYDSARNVAKGLYAVTANNGILIINIRILKSFLDSAVFPVFLDPVVRVQGNARGTSATSTNVVTMSSTPTNGNVEIAIISTGSETGSPITSIVQTGVTWNRVIANEWISMWTIEIWLGVVGAGASVTVTINLDQAVNSVADICEYSGIAVNPTDKTAVSADGNSATSDTGTTASTTQASELWIGAVGCYQQTQSDPTNGFTLLDGALYVYNSCVFLEKIVSGTGAANSGTTLSGSNYWIGCIATFKAISNNNPSNDGCQFTNLDDTDNIYAQLKNYIITVNCSDADGYADLVTVDVTLQTGATVERITFRYTEGTNTFSEQSGSTTAWTLTTGSCVATKDGNDCDLAFYFLAEWDATEESDLDVKVVTTDSAAATDTDTYDLNVDIVVTLTISSFASNPVEYINPSSTVTYSGIVYYVNNPSSSTATTFYPPDAEFTSVIVHDSAHATKGTDTTIVNGAFSLTFTSDATVGQDTYHPYINMADADYTDADASGITDTVTVEQVQVQSYTVTDSRVNIADIVNVDVHLHYASDGSAVTDGTVRINGAIVTSNLGLGSFRLSVASATVTGTTYNTVAITGNTRVITSVDQNSQSQLVVWDKFDFISVAVDDSRIDISSTFEIRYVIQYDYDNVVFDNTKGSITGFAYDAVNSWWDKTVTGSASVTSTNYDETYVTLTDSTYGLTSKEDDAGVNVITDRIQVQSYTVTDARVNIADNVNIDFLLYYDYDNSVVTDGTVTLNTYSATHQGTGTWRITKTSSSVAAVTYNTVACTGNAYGITSVDQNGQAQAVIWDRIKLLTLTTTATSPAVGENVIVRATAELEYDNHAVGSGDTLALGSYSFTWDAGEADWTLEHGESSEATVTISTFGTSAEATYGITSASMNSLSVTITWVGGGGGGGSGGGSGGGETPVIPVVPTTPTTPTIPTVPFQPDVPVAIPRELFQSGILILGTMIVGAIVYNQLSMKSPKKVWAKKTKNGVFDKRSKEWSDKDKKKKKIFD